MAEWTDLERDRSQDPIESALPVGGDDDDPVTQVICVPHFALRHQCHNKDQPCSEIIKYRNDRLNGPICLSTAKVQWQCRH